jgi:hypothetical protein
MKYDQYGRPLVPYQGYGGQNGGYNQPPGTASPVTAKLDMPNLAQLGGHGQVPWVRFPFYPTSPFYSTNPNVGTQTRFYGATLLSTDADFVLGTEAIRIVQFDIPCRLIAVTGAAVDTAAGAGGLNNLLNGFLFRMEYTTGDRLNTAARLASTCLGTMQQPGEIGGVGYNIDSGASWVLGITPLANLPTNIRIDITLICLEIRGPSNYNMVP